jgi:hypothetical protein
LKPAPSLSHTGLNAAWSDSLTLGDVKPLMPVLDRRIHMFRPQVWLNRGFGLHPAVVARRSSTHDSESVPPLVAVSRGNEREHFAVDSASVPPQPDASLSSTRGAEACVVHVPAVEPVVVQAPMVHVPIRRIEGLPSVV